MDGNCTKYFPAAYVFLMDFVQISGSKDETHLTLFCVLRMTIFPSIYTKYSKLLYLTKNNSLLKMIQLITSVPFIVGNFGAETFAEKNCS